LGGGGDGSGAGGGGGGGVIEITAGGNIHLGATGQVLATGGDGGDLAGGGVKSGGGGGGAGGAIVLIAGGTLVDDGVINADGGQGGGTTAPAVDGNGAQGRTRFVNSGIAWTGTGTESPLPNMPGSVANSFGQTWHSKSSYWILSKSFDTENSSPVYTGITKTESKPTGSTITYQLAGSSDDFQSDTTGFVDSSQISQLNGKRYFKVKILMSSDPTDRTHFPEVSALSINFDPHFQNEFLFKSLAGCAAIHHSDKDSDQRSGPIATLLFLFTLYLVTRIPILKRRPLRYSR
jgi:hypothetical protein